VLSPSVPRVCCVHCLRKVRIATSGPFLAPPNCLRAYLPNPTVEQTEEIISGFSLGRKRSLSGGSTPYWRETWSTRRLGDKIPNSARIVPRHNSTVIHNFTYLHLACAPKYYLFVLCRRIIASSLTQGFIRNRLPLCAHLIPHSDYDSPRHTGQIFWNKNPSFSSITPSGRILQPPISRLDISLCFSSRSE
jgi:hypothetical protein